MASESLASILPLAALAGMTVADPRLPGAAPKVIPRETVARPLLNGSIAARGSTSALCLLHNVFFPNKTTILYTQVCLKTTCAPKRQ